MSSTRTFSAMLNEYLPNELLKEELIKRDYLLQKVEKDNSWLGGNLVVPFEGGVASTVTFGSLASSSDVSEYNYQRGGVSVQPEVWGTLLFNHRDLMEHGKVSEQNFLQILPNQVDQFIQYMKEVCSMNMLGNPYFDTATVAGTSLGVLETLHVERYTIGQKVNLFDPNGSAQASFYVIGVDLNGGTLLNGAVTFSATRGGSAASITGYTATTQVFQDGVAVAGVATNGFTSLKQSLLSAANGGSTTLYGKIKTTYPYLQAVNVSGASITSVNLLEKLFDGYNAVRIKARGNANTFLMSYKHLGTAMKIIEAQKGGFKVTATTQEASIYGWTEVQITSVKGVLTLVGIQEMEDDHIDMIDWSALKFYSNGFFKKRQNPDGREFFEVRNTTGYQYLVDVCLFGDLILQAPSRCGIIFGISY